MEYLIIILIGVIGFLYFQNKEKDKKLNGELRETQSDGSIRVGKYKDGKQYGECALYGSNGKIKTRMNYENGKLNGDYIIYGYNENIIEKGQYLNDEKVGVWERFYENGQIKFKDGKGFFEDGSLKNEKTDNQFKEYFKNGNVKLTKEYEYSPNNPEIILFEREKKFFPNAIVSERNTFEYKNRRRYKCSQHLYYENGNLKSKGFYIDTGHRKDNIGKWEYYYENGNLKREGSFTEEGNSNGIWKNYYENGKIESYGEYLGSWQKNGIWHFFNEEGIEIEQKVFNT